MEQTLRERNYIKHKRWKESPKGIAWIELNKNAVKAYNKIYRENNKEKLKARQHQRYKENYIPRARKPKRPEPNKVVLKEWRDAHRDHVNAQARRYYSQMPRDVMRARRRKYAINNPDMVRSWSVARYARKLGASGSHTVAQWMERVRFHGWCCRYCKQELNGKNLVKEHMIPLARGGSQWPANLVPSCKSCNQYKHKKTYFEYIAMREAA